MTLYLDTSSLVKLYVVEPGSTTVHDHVGSADLVATSSIAYTEARAGLARRRRERALTPAAFVAAKKALDTDWPTYLSVEVTPSLCREAGELAERYRLRAYDSVHLAAFAEVARAAGPGNTLFSSFDAALDRAARLLSKTLARK